MNKSAKKKNQTFIIALCIALVVFAAYLYVSSNRVYGIKVSCNDLKIIDIEKMPPPLMEVVQPSVCNIDYSASYNAVVICHHTTMISNSEIGYGECKELKSYAGTNVTVHVIFSNVENTTILKEVQTNIAVP